MTTRTKSIWAIVMGAAAIFFAVYTINSYNKKLDASATSKIIVDVFGVLFVIGAIGAIWHGAKSLSA